jgi:hypothetical protein
LVEHTSQQLDAGDMIEVGLYTRGNELITTIFVLDHDPPAEAVWWGRRLFVRRDDIHYVEGICWVADRLKWLDET